MSQLETRPIMQLHTVCDDTSALDKYLTPTDAGGMELVGFLALLILLDVLALRFGRDSRLLDPRDRRGWWPG
jgi:hypothetical protein